MSLDDVASQYRFNLTRAASITGLGEQIIDISIGSLQKIGAETRENSTKQRVKNQTEMIAQLYNSPILKEMVLTITGQQVVLTVSAFEIFMNDLVRCIGNEHRKLIKWPEKSTGKVDLAILSSDVATLGDLILGVIQQQSISFQDLQSTKRFLKEYLGIDIQLTTEEEEEIILASAARNALVHSGGEVDTQFLKQVRNTSFAERFQHGQKIQVSIARAKKFRQIYQKFGRAIMIKIKRKAS